MSRINDAVEKYGLRDICSVRGEVGQKMSEECIQMFVASDPSGNGKYLDWMFLQAGGGKSRLDKSIQQWEAGDHGDKPVKFTLRGHYIDDCMKGYTDENGKVVDPVSETTALNDWSMRDEERFKKMHIYGDEEYALVGFGFYRDWPGHSNLYAQISIAVNRFHKYRQKLLSSGKSLDLNSDKYPDLRNLLEALSDVTALELKDHIVYDAVYMSDILVVVCPLNIGASLKFGHNKWCTANESMFKSAVSGQGPNRWKEYAKNGALYYCKFRARVTTQAEVAVGMVSPISQIAVQIPFSGAHVVNAWKYYDTEDRTHSKSEIDEMVKVSFGHMALLDWKEACLEMERHHADYPKDRLNLEIVVIP